MRPCFDYEIQTLQLSSRPAVGHHFVDYEGEGRPSHRSLTNPTAANPKETGFLVAADGFMGQRGIKGAKQPKSNHYRALDRIDR
jgi:hypothetical protein